MKNTCLSLLFLFFCFHLPGQNSEQKINFVIKGQIVDSAGVEPVSFATIKVLTADDMQLVKALAADDRGQFSTSVNSKGKYVLEISYMGKENILYHFNAEKSETLNIGKLEMKDGSTTLSEVVVSAAKPLVTVDFDKISYNIQEDPDAKSNNVLEMMKKVPLITVDGEENIQLKGSSNFKIYLNGKPSNMISSNPRDVLKSMPANTIKDIEVITDPGAKYDAEGVAGIINIITISQSALGGFTTTLNAGANTMGGYDGGAYLMMKYGKIGFTGNYNYYTYKSPGVSFNTERTDYTSSDSRYLSQFGNSPNDGKGQYSSGELSFEIDTFNLLNAGFYIYSGNGKSNSDFELVMRDADMNLVDNYIQKGYMLYEYGNIGANIDYQRSFMTPQRLLTISYRYDYSPNDWGSETSLDSIFGYTPSRRMNQKSDAGMDEHTLQADYTTPIAKIHTIEAGLKYIYRTNYSKSSSQLYDSQSETWSDIKTDIDEFSHNSSIIGIYGSYALRLDKWGLKTGLRYEGTGLDVKYPLNELHNFSIPFNHNLVPSVTVTYKLTPMQNLRLGYNKRISRPGISQLNPYVNNSNSQFIRYGNPNLEPVDNHSIGLNYGLYQPKFNLNMNLSYSFQNNSIENVTTVDNGVSISTYENIGENKRTNLSAYFSWNPSEKFRISQNSWLGYVDIKANNNSGLANSGFTGGVYVSGNYVFPYKINFSINGGYYAPNIRLLGEGSTYMFHGLSLSKSFLSEKLNVRLYTYNPFTKEMKYESREQTPEYAYYSAYFYPQRQVSLNVSYKFGEMKEQIKKAQRGISNDDVMNDGSGQGGGSGNQSGGKR